MEIFVDVVAKGKDLTPGNIVLRSVVLMNDNSREQIKNQVLESIKQKSEEYVNHLPGKFGRGEKYIFMFAYSILDKFDAETNVWSGAQAQISLMNIQAMDQAPLIQTAQSLS
jgi:hypothetical protein